MQARSRVEILSSSLQQKLELSLNISAVSGSSCLTKISLGCLFEETYYILNESILIGERNICIEFERDENECPTTAPRDIFAKLNPHVRSTLRYTTILYQMSWLTSRDQITFDLKGAKSFVGFV